MYASSLLTLYFIVFLVAWIRELYNELVEGRLERFRSYTTRSKPVIAARARDLG